MQTNFLLKKWQGLLSSESKRWAIQFLIMLGAMPYVGVVTNVIAFPVNFFGWSEKFGWLIYVIGFLVCFSYYLISIKLHLIFDKKKTFSRSPLFSIRPYITIPLVIQTLASWGIFLGIPQELGDFVLEFYKPINDFTFVLLFISSVLLTWLLSEWVCRFQRWRGRVNEVALAKDVG